MLESWWLLILLPLATFSGWYFARHTKQTPQSKRSSLQNLPSEYFKGLNFLLNEQSDKAIDAFESAINEQADSIEVKLVLGNVFRRKGEIEKATRIHQNLISDTHSDPQLRALALYELAQDYQKAGLYDRAEKLFLELSDGNFQNDVACTHLLQIYEQEKDWENAISIIDKSSSRPSEQNRVQKSHYYCELAELAFTQGCFADSEKLVEQALATDSENLRAVIQRGRIETAHGDHKKALKLWKTVVARNSLYVREVIDLIVNAYRSLNDEQALNGYLREIIELHKSVRALILLTENTLKMSGRKYTEEKLVGWLRNNPSLSGLRKLLEIKMKDNALSNANKQDMLLLSNLLDSVIDVQPDYQCRYCGFSGKNFYWQCPSCRLWNSIMAQRQVLTQEMINDTLAD